MSSLLRSSIRDALWVGSVLASSCVLSAPSRAQTCTNGDVQSAQTNTATQADIQLMEQAGTFVFGTVMDVAGAGAVENVFATALNQGVSGASTDVVGAELACQQTEITQITSEVANLQSNLANLSAQLASQVNADLANNIATDSQRLRTDIAALNPVSASNPKLANGERLASVVTGGRTSASAPTKVDLNTARVTAVDAQGLADLYMQQFQNRWIGDDLDKKGATPTPHFEPYPALHTYFLALQVWMTAMSLEQAALGPSGFSTIKAEYGADLLRHRNFLTSRASGGRGASNSANNPAYDPLPDQITKQVSCTWNLGNPYPSGGQCAAYPTCTDQIQPNKTWKTSQTFTFAGVSQNQMCQIDTQTLPPIDELSQIYQHYGLTQVAQMAQIVDSMYRTGSMAVATSPSTGSFGSSNAAAAISVYTVDASGTIFHEAGSSNQQMTSPQQITSGWAGVRSLLPGGGPAFYTVTQAGALNWYSFLSTAAAPTGPVQLAANFGSYKNVFGAGDGIIYGIGQDGTLSWYRHSNLTTGGGPSALSPPKSVGSGWNQYAFVFAAGSGVIYAVQNDGTVLWLRHMDYLTGDSIQASTTTPPAPAGRALNTRLPPRAQAHWQGPIKVASGWTGLRSVVAAGGGVILAVKADGSVLWYKHDNYLTGQSTAAPAASQNTAAPVAASLHNATAPNWGTLGSPSSSSTGSGFGQGSMAGGAGSTASAWRTSSSLGTPMNNSTQAAPGAPISSLSRSRGFDGQAAQMQGTQPATALNGSTLNGSTLNANTPGKVPAPTAAGQPQWEGPITIGTGWQRFPLIAAVLPTTVNAPIR
jgi:Tachylectin